MKKIIHFSIYDICRDFYRLPNRGGGNPNEVFTTFFRFNFKKRFYQQQKNMQPKTVME